MGRMITAWLLPLLLAAPGTAPDAQENPEPARYVRIVLPGAARRLSLAEVEVFVGGQNVAGSGEASQSSVTNDGVPERAIDGSTAGDYPRGSVTHSARERDPSWELDLKDPLLIERIVVWNRTDCCDERLRGFTLQLLDRRHKLLWERRHNPAARQVEIIPFTEAPPPPEIKGATPQERREFQPRIDHAIDTGIGYLLRQQLWDGSFRQHSDRFPVGSTGLSMYTLLKSGVAKDHPAVLKAAEFIVNHPPRETYELGTCLMALGALGDPEHEDLMEDMLERLLSYQGAKSADARMDAMWAYPDHGDLADLSNTQYAALGLRAALEAGLKIPAKAWTSLAESTLRYQEAPKVVEDPLATDDSSATLRIAGFPYRVGQVPSASMTTAGLGVLGICVEGLERFPGKLRRQVDDGHELAVNWLTYNFSVVSNVGGGDGNLLYYLYGLERVGALFEVELLGPHDWYWEGAKELVKRQGGEGQWSNENDTCFALLFLSRATAAPTSGLEPVTRTPKGTWIAEHQKADVRWRITGGKQAVFFVSGFSDLAIDDYAQGEGSTHGLRVLGVEYLVDGEVVGTAPADSTRKWAGQRFALRHEFTARGQYQCEVRVRVQLPDDHEGSTAELHGAPLTVQITDVYDPAQLEFASHSRENLLSHTKVVATGSTQNGDNQSPAQALDGRMSTGWVAAKADATPWLRLELARPQRGRVLLLSQVNVAESDRNSHDRATRVLVKLNGRASMVHELEIPDDDEKKGVLRLKKSVPLRQVEIKILERTAGTRHPGLVGFSEIEWLSGR